MSIFQHHPDGIIYVRVGADTYADTVANFALDCAKSGVVYSGLPAGKVDRIYAQDAPKQHTVADSHGNQSPLKHPYVQGDAIIANIAALLAAQAARVPPHNMKWDATAASGAGGWVLDVAKAAAEKLNIINTACAAAIVGGFSSSALGAAHTYNSKLEDQVNLTAVASAGIDYPYQCTDATGVKAEVLHTAAQIKKVFADGMTFKSAQLTKFRSLKAQLETLAASTSTTQADIDLVVW